MKISIITTVYKAEKDLPRLLDSMMAQKNENLEFFLIDNGSPDNCGEICQEYAKKDRRFKIYTLKENVGYIKARNLGIKEVDADYVGFCDSDDYLEPQGYDRAIEILEKTQCDLYITAYKTITKDNSVICQAPYSKGLYLEHDIEETILPQAFGFLPGKPPLHGFAWKQIFKRDLFVNNHLEFMPELQPYEDQVLNVDFIKNCKQIYIDENVIYNYIVNPESITAKLISNFDLVSEWNRVVLFYNEKNIRASKPLHEEALANQTLGFIYSMVSNSVKTGINQKKISSALKSTITLRSFQEMTNKSSRKISRRLRFTKWTISNNQFRILVALVRLGQKLRG